jgi:hypothetical protein
MGMALVSSVRRLLLSHETRSKKAIRAYYHFVKISNCEMIRFSKAPKMPILRGVWMSGSGAMDAHCRRLTK